MLCEIGKESAHDLYSGHCRAGVTAKRLTDELVQCSKGVVLRTPGSVDPTPNAVCVWVGGPGVTANSDEATGGVPIPPGESLFVPIDDPSRLWVVSTDADQDVAWMAM